MGAPSSGASESESSHPITLKTHQDDYDRARVMKNDELRQEI